MKLTDEVREAISICPREVKNYILGLSCIDEVEEIRFRNGQTVYVTVNGREECPGHVLVKSEWLEQMVFNSTGHAVYSAQQMLKNGFVTIPGGHRIGICGTAVYQGDNIITLKEISSVNLRIARQIRGVADKAADYLWIHPNATLIIGAPGIGKTTFLRDLIYQLSTRYSWRIGVADERKEIAACYEGKPQFFLGEHTDILSEVKKDKAIEFLLRTMSPQWIAVDEITAASDIEAILHGSYCGVNFLATAHASCREELRSRPLYQKLLSCGIFQNLILIRPDRSLCIERMSL